MQLIAICGKVCSGKSMLAQHLAYKEKAVILSVDDMLISLLGTKLGNKHDEIAQKAQKYLLNMALSILHGGANVILDWGFYTKEGRTKLINFFNSHGIIVDWYYTRVTDSQCLK